MDVDASLALTSDLEAAEASLAAEAKWSLRLALEALISETDIIDCSLASEAETTLRLSLEALICESYSEVEASLILFSS